MTLESSVRDLVDAANAPLSDPEMNIVIGDDQPRFELYHFALSLCSQKVRLCLMEKGASFAAHDINLQMPDLGNYDPNYVKLRLSAEPGSRQKRRAGKGSPLSLDCRQATWEARMGLS